MLRCPGFDKSGRRGRGHSKIAQKRKIVSGGGSLQTGKDKKKAQWGQNLRERLRERRSPGGRS